nr:hypothetical protein [Mitsuokella multacida]
MAKDGYTEARIKSVLTNLDNKCREEAAVAILKSTEDKQIIRKARKVLHLAQDSKEKSVSRQP